MLHFLAEVDKIGMAELTIVWRSLLVHASNDALVRNVLLGIVSLLSSLAEGVLRQFLGIVRESLLGEFVEIDPGRLSVRPHERSRGQRLAAAAVLRSLLVVLEASWTLSEPMHSAREGGRAHERLCADQKRSAAVSLPRCV